jgi:hypothetical protein
LWLFCPSSSASSHNSFRPEPTGAIRALKSWQAGTCQLDCTKKPTYLFANDLTLWVTVGELATSNQTPRWDESFGVWPALRD